jgi:hypothetical protein
MEDPKNQTDNSASPVDTTPKVTGVGGIFFFQTIRRKRENGMPKI